MRPLCRSLAALLAALLAAAPAFASQPALPLAGQVAGARTSAAELKAAQAAVDASLKVRKQRSDAWQKAARARDAAAQDVAAKKRAGITGAPLEAALKKALALDEEAARARSALLSAESDVARGGAELLRLYDAILVEKRRAVEALPAQSAARADAVTTYRQLAAQRDAVRQALLPVLGDAPAAPELPKGVDLEARSDDDVETLLEKADLARDLEARFLRQAEAVRRRIAELEEEQAVAKDVSGMIGRSQLFDEEDRRIPVLRTETTTTTTGGNNALSGGTNNDAARGTTGGNFFGDGASAPEASDVDSAPPPAAPGGVSGTPVTSVTTTSVVRTEQAFALPLNDPGIASALSSSTSVESLKALEAKLKAQAQALRDKSKKLKGAAEERAHE